MTTASTGPAPAGRRLRLGFGLRGPQRPRHVLTEHQLTSVGLPVGGDGVIVGLDEHGGPAVLGLGRAAPLAVALVGGLWTAQVVALRAAATGARVAVETGRPQRWAALAQMAGGGQQCVTLHDVGRVPPQGPTLDSPVLVLRDAGPRPPRTAVPQAPWQSVLTVLPYLGPDAEPVLRDAAIVGVQRVSPGEAALVARIMALPAPDADALPALDDRFTLWCTPVHRHLVATAPTEAETGLLGPARRVD